MANDSKSFDRGLADLADVARREEALRSRLQLHDRSIAAGLSGTFAGTLAELVETAAPVTILTRTGSTIRGIVSSIDVDVTTIRLPDSSSHVLIRTSAIDGVREPGRGHDRHLSESSGSSLAELLDRFTDDRDRVAITLASGQRFMGAALRVGLDQIVLRLDGESDSITVPIAAIDQVMVGR